MAEIDYDLDPEADIACYTFGNEGRELLLADSYLKGALALKEHAVSMNDFSKADTFYPGTRMAVPQEYTISLIRNLGYFIENHFQLNIRTIKKAASRFSIVTTPPEQLDFLQRIPHFDSPSPHGLAVILYLQTLPGFGTSLYRHKSSGFETIDEQRYPQYHALLDQQFHSAQETPQGYIHQSTDQFEEIASFDAVFNRLVMYRGFNLHSAKIGANYNYDPHPATGRLTITSFIEFNEVR